MKKIVTSRYGIADHLRELLEVKLPEEVDYLMVGKLNKGVGEDTFAHSTIQ